MKYDPRVVVDASGKHVQEFMVPCFMTDASYRMTASAFMTMAQEMAMNSAEILGFGFDSLFPNYHMAWVLSRFQFKFIKPVLWRDNVLIRTWHKGVQSIFYVRDFELLGEDGETAALGTSSWVILDMENRSLVKMTELPDCVSPEPMLLENAYETLAPKVAMPRKIEPVHVKDHVVVYSDLDINGHTNNVRYVDWAMDCIDPEIILNCPVKELAINFNKETRAGDCVSLLMHETTEGDDRIIYVEGQVEGKQSFCVRIAF